jgi:hypothetical protein
LEKIILVSSKSLDPGPDLDPYIKDTDQQHWIKPWMRIRIRIEAYADPKHRYRYLIIILPLTNRNVKIKHLCLVKLRTQICSLKLKFHRKEPTEGFE